MQYVSEAWPLKENEVIDQHALFPQQIWPAPYRDVAQLIAH